MHYEAKIHTGSMFIRNQFVFVDTPPLNVSFNRAKDLGQASYNKLQPQKTGPFLVIHVHLHRVVINKAGVQNRMSIRRVTLASRLKKISCNGADTGLASEPPMFDTRETKEINGRNS